MVRVKKVRIKKYESQEMKIVNVQRLRTFLGDTSGTWAVFRKPNGVDNCFTEASAIFDLGRASLHIWSGINPREKESLVLNDISNFTKIREQLDQANRKSFK